MKKKGKPERESDGGLSKQTVNPNPSEWPIKRITGYKNPWL
jgi:hypothetical protein